MRIENIPNPGAFSGAQALRVLIAKAISFVETTGKLATDGKSSLGYSMYKMFQFAQAAVEDFLRPAAVSISATPATASLTPGATQQISVVATLDPAGTETVTAQCTFTVSSPSRTVVSASGLISVPEDAQPGQSTVTTHYMGLTDTTVVTVTAE